MVEKGRERKGYEKVVKARGGGEGKGVSTQT